MTRAADLAKLIAGGGSITVSDNSENLKLITTDADANDGPLLSLSRDSSSPADGDLTGRINFNADNDAGEVTAFSSIRTFIRDASDGTEDGAMQLNHMFGGSEVTAFEIDNDEYVINQGSNDIDFRVESNGDANMFFVDAGNDRIYMGRNASDGVAFARLQIEAQDSEAAISIHRGSASSGGPGLFFSKSRAATAGDDTVVQSGDEIGKLFFTGADGTDRETPAAEIKVEVDGTPGGNDMPGRMVFGTTADGASSVTERMRINSSGKLLLGTTGNTTARLNIGFSHSASEVGIRLTPDATTATQMRFDNSGGTSTGTITTSGSGTAYNTSSDYRLKENVTTSWDATSRLKQLKPSRFNFKTDKDITIDGFLAHEVSSIVPEAVSGKKDAVDKDGNIDPQGIDQSKLVPLLVKTIQELEARIATLESK